MTEKVLDQRTYQKGTAVKELRENNIRSNILCI